MKYANLSYGKVFSKTPEELHAARMAEEKEKANRSKAALNKLNAKRAIQREIEAMPSLEDRLMAYATNREKLEQE